MYLHLGQDVVVTKDSVIGVFDLDNSSKSYLTREYLAGAQKDGNITNVSDNLPKSFVVCTDHRVFLCQLSTATLLKRNETDQIIFDQHCGS